WVLAAAALASMIGSGYALSRRLEAYNRAHPRPIFVFRQIQKRQFEYAGHPVTIEDRVNDAGEGQVVVAYAGDELAIPVQAPSEHELPGLQRHRDWLAVLAMAEKTGHDA